MSSAATLVAGVATLLIALGVGVLIGHDSNTPPQQKASQIIVPGGSSSGGTSSGLTNTTASSGANPAQATKPSAAAKASLKHAKTVVVHLSPKIEQKAAAAAQKVFGQSGNLTKNPTQQVGGACSGGSGCQNGKFTGNFFPGG